MLADECKLRVVVVRRSSPAVLPCCACCAALLCLLRWLAGPPALGSAPGPRPSTVCPLVSCRLGALPWAHPFATLPSHLCIILTLPAASSRSQCPSLPLPANPPLQVDTSNEIGGDGDIPHPGLGRARRMQVGALAAAGGGGSAHGSGGWEFSRLLLAGLNFGGACGKRARPVAACRATLLPPCACCAC